MYWRGGCSFLIFAAAAIGQDVAVVRSGDFYLQGFGGFNFYGGVNRISTTAIAPGLTPNQLLTPNTNGNVGVQAEFSFTRHFAFEAEYSYNAGGSLSFNQDYVVSENPERLRRVQVDAHSSSRIGCGALIYRIPLQSAPRLVPYVAIGTGVVRTHFALSQAIIGDVPGETFSGSTKANDMVGLAGIGSRYYFTERLGFVTELRVFAGPNVRTLGRLTVGVFFKAR